MAGSVVIDGIMGSLSVSGSTLKGVGTAVGGVSASSGVISFGSSPGIFTIKNGLSIGSSATYSQEFISGVPGTGFDQAIVTGSVVISNAILSFDVSGEELSVGQYIIIDNDGIDPVEGSFVSAYTRLTVCS